jgi:hypothetical protein
MSKHMRQYNKEEREGVTIDRFVIRVIYSNNLINDNLFTTAKDMKKYNANACLSGADYCTVLYGYERNGSTYWTDKISLNGKDIIKQATNETTATYYNAVER